MRIRVLAAVFGAAIFAGFGAGQASAQLSRADQLFLYFNYYHTQRTTIELQQQQLRQQRSLNQLNQQQQIMARDFDPRFARPGRYQPRRSSSPQVSQGPELPPIYNSQGQSRFLNYGRYFTPPR